MLTKKQIELLRTELETAQNPLFYYDDDPDGVCSFILLYKLHREGKGVILKSAPKLDMGLYRKVEENHPDKIFVLDIPMIEQEFIDKANRPMFWIDHHEPLKLKKIKYYNPRIKRPDAYIPTTRMAYQINNSPENLWVATIGCLADWHMPNFIEEFIKKYPHLLSEKKDLNHAVYQQPIGKLIRIFSFLLKGSTSDVNKSIKILTRIKSPDEILNQTTSAGKYLYNRFEKINKYYKVLIEDVKKKVTKSKLLLYNYSENQNSFTVELANELTNLYPKKVILIARKKGGEMKCSLRSKKNIRDPLNKALEGVEGYGGGHENACGAVINEKSWDLFLKNLKKEI